MVLSLASSLCLVALARLASNGRQVELLREEQFEKDAADQRKSRRQKWADRDLRVLREMFQQAVDSEKERIIQELKVCLRCRSVSAVCSALAWACNENEPTSALVCL